MGTEMCLEHKRHEQMIADTGVNIEKLYQVTEKIVIMVADEKEKRMIEEANVNKKIYVLLGLLIGLNIIESGLLSLL